MGASRAATGKNHGFDDVDEGEQTSALSREWGIAGALDSGLVFVG